MAITLVGTGPGRDGSFFRSEGGKGGGGFRLLCWRSLLIFAATFLFSCLYSVGGQYVTIDKTVATPHLVARIQTQAVREYEGDVVARIYAIYEIDTNDLDTTSSEIIERVSVALNDLPVEYLELDQLNWLTSGRRCTAGDLVCRNWDDRTYTLLGPGIGGAYPEAYNGNLADVDPRLCESSNGELVVDNPTTVETTPTPPSEFNPTWELNAELDKLIAEYSFCVHKDNTSLVWYPLLIENVFVTGYRDYSNTYLSDQSSQGIELTFWVVGIIPVTWAKFFNAKFKLNESIPLPMYQPEVVDPDAVWTNKLNFSTHILGIVTEARDAEEGGDVLEYSIPVCQDPKTSGAGCVEVVVDYYLHPMMPQYKLRNIVEARKANYTIYASDQPYPDGDFNVSQGPWPLLEWIADPEDTNEGPWSLLVFPQKESIYNSECVADAACDTIYFAPPLRHLHSAILYKTWNFTNQAWRYLCDEEESCGEDCLTNLGCLGGEDYFDSNYFFRSTYYADDDGGIVPLYTLQDATCPTDCCQTRRLCLRTHDVMGYEVPFDREYMLVFGGKSYMHIKDPSTGKLIYHSCERIASSDLLEDWRSCYETVLGDIWRYDISGARWDYIKPDSAISATTGQKVGYPLERYGHAAVLLGEVEGNDEYYVRYYMYIYGGLSPQCSSGNVCSDVWRYEVPFAAQAYYPQYSDETWDRANQWSQLKDCTYGGRYRHSMVATSGMEYIYVYGGQVIGKFVNTLLRYRVSTDMWEDLDPFGSISLTRLMYDYYGDAVVQQIPVENYNSDVDVDCSNAWTYENEWAHCAVCADCGLLTGTRDEEGVLLPAERGDSVMVNFADFTEGSVDDSIVIFGGYRTTWGTLVDESYQECTTTTTTTSTTYDTSLLEALSDAATTTQAATTTTYYEAGGVQVIGTFGDSSATSAPTTTTTTLGYTTTSTTTLRMVVVTHTTTTTTRTKTETSTTTVTSTTTTTTDTGTTTEYTGPTTNPLVEAGTPESAGPTTWNSTPGETYALWDDDSTTDRVGPQACQVNTYYFNDLWMYEATTNQFFERQTSSTSLPTARKGHQMIARRSSSNDTQIVLFGGQNQDKVMNDMWVLNIMRDQDSRLWAQVDPYFEGDQPPPMAYHSMLYSETLNKIIVFGGLTWEDTDLDASDTLRNVDRRCLKKAQDLIENYDGETEADFMEMMSEACASSNFCCMIGGVETPPVYLDGTRIRTSTGALNLTAISLLCQQDCEEKAFYTEYYAKMIEGVWLFETGTCPNNCSSRGYCDMSQCVCEPNWYGIDCSQNRCPGTFCYTNSLTKEQFCMECASHGRCTDGECVCFPGWGFNDCSAVLCEDNCSSTAIETRGICIEDFPVHQCVCQGAWSGTKCDTLLCLNGCSNHGTCTSDGVCECHNNFAGDDCSIFTFPIE